VSALKEKKEGESEKQAERSSGTGKSTEGKKNKAHVMESDDFEESDGSTFMVYVGEYQTDDAWYMDGGATNHMTDPLDWFASFRGVPHGRWPVMIADNRQLWVCGVGRINVKCEVDGVWKFHVVQRVLYIPELRRNLFSIGQVSDKGFMTTYTRHSCYLTSNDEHGKVVLTGT
jgi:hypothetical protein